MTESRFKPRYITFGVIALTVIAAAVWLTIKATSTSGGGAGGAAPTTDADAPPADLDLIEIAEKAPLATLCLETALARHDLVDTIPAATNIAIPRGSTRPQLRAAHRLHHFDPTTFELGRQLLDVGARKPLGLYSAERTIVDMVRLRHEQGPEQAWEALRRWLARPGRNLGQLLALAGQFAGAEAPLRAALEVLL